MTISCSKDKCFECEILETVGGPNGPTFTYDSECGKDLTYNEAYLTVEKRNNVSGGMTCYKK